MIGLSSGVRLCRWLLVLGLVAGSACKGKEEVEPGVPFAEAGETETSAAGNGSAGESPSAGRKAAGGVASGPAEAIDVGEAVETIPWQAAGEHIDDEVFVVGRIVRVGQSKSGHVFLNFDKSDRDALTLFIHKDSVKNFPQPPQEMYRDRLIKARGFVYEFDGKPNLSVKEPGDLAVLPDDTPLPVASGPAESSPAAVRDRADGIVRLASYNVLNLFDGRDDPYSADSSADMKPRAELEALARSIRGLDADVLCLQEVENRGYLQRFVKVFLRDMGYEVVAFEGNDNRGIDVAILSRLPVGPVTSHRHVTFEDPQGKASQFRRDLLQARIEPQGGAAFNVFVVHLKSKGGDPTGGADTRMGEAQAIRAVLERELEAEPQGRFVICGDFNDTLDSGPLQTIIGKHGPVLTTFVKDLPEDGRVSYNQPPYLSMIDFILASPGMAERYVAGSYKIMTGGSPESTGSDHNPVVAEFKMQ